MKTYTLLREQTIDRPLDEVFPFFEKAENLGRLVPDFLHFRIETPLPIEMREGALIEYRIKLFGVPLTWKTRIEEYEPPRRFVDVQLRGPYKLWRHEHTFEPIEGDSSGTGKTLMRDRVDYAIGWGPVGSLAHAVFARATLDKIFGFRAERTREIFSAGTEREGASSANA